MFRNYLTIALRNLSRHKLFSIINIAGLAVGLASVLLIALFVRSELSYDRWIPGVAHIYRAEVTFTPPGRPPIQASTAQFLLTPAMKAEIPEVRDFTRLLHQYMTIMVGDHQFLDNVELVDRNFLQVFKLPLVAGDPATVLSQPQSVVLSQATARKYFGDADPIGKIITTGRGGCEPADTACADSIVSLKVTGVLRDLPENTHLAINLLVPNTSLVNRTGPKDLANWLASNTFGYVVLAPGADPRAVMAKTIPIMDRNVDLSTFINAKIPGSKIAQITLTPVVDAHLTTDRLNYSLKPAGSWDTLYGMMVVGALLLLIACFNFMNLATARASLRAREISLRKCMGATRGQLIAQFLGESVLMALLALVLALALGEVFLSLFSRMVGRGLAFSYVQDWPVLLGMVGMALLAGLFSGLYPALVLSGFRPGATLRANNSGQGGAGLLRTVLVVLQFAVSIGLGIAALVVFTQINYARNMDMGFRHDNIALVSTGRMTLETRESFMQTLARGPGITAVAFSSSAPFDSSRSAVSVQVPGNPQFFTPDGISVSPEFFDLYGMKILAGRNFIRGRTEDTVETSEDARNENHHIILNSAAARQLGFPDDQSAVGKTLLFNKDHLTVIGVVENALVRGATVEMAPLVYYYAPKVNGTFSVRLQPSQIPAALAYIDRTWKQFQPIAFNNRKFLSDDFAKLYAADQRQGEILGLFVGLAIFVASLGLFGLAAFTAGRRNREIGIRKVFGARTRDVIALLLWQFSRPVLVANLIAWPVAWYYLRGFLNGYAYRIDMNPLYFLGVGLAALLIAWITIFGHALKVARANPIKALRYE